MKKNSTWKREWFWVQLNVGHWEWRVYIWLIGLMYVFKSNHSQHDRLVHYQESHLMYIDPAFRVSSVRHDPAPTHARRFNMTFAMNRSQRREFIRNNLTGFPLAPHPPVAFNQGVPMNRLWRAGLMEVRPSPSLTKIFDWFLLETPSSKWQKDTARFQPG